MSVWLHDIGKLVTPLEVMNKMARLLPEQMADFTHRMQVVRLLAKLRGESGETERETRETLEWVKKLNTAGFASDEDLARLEQLRQRTYLDEDGVERPWLEPSEYAMLSIRRGTLSGEERRIMEGHVVITEKLLSEIHFSEELRHVPEWASAHHELLNGSGYPRHWAGTRFRMKCGSLRSWIFSTLSWRTTAPTSRECRWKRRCRSCARWRNGRASWTRL